MEAYTGFAEIYDRCMDNIPYDAWAAHIGRLLKEYGIEKGIVCELGCGTGEMTGRLSDMGYDMIGIDSSEDMLMEAREKLYERGDLYQKVEETHIQQAYSVAAVKELLTEAGMVFIDAFDAETGRSADAASERILFLAKEGFQPGKCYENRDNNA